VRGCDCVVHHDRVFAVINKYIVLCTAAEVHAGTKADPAVGQVRILSLTHQSWQAVLNNRKR
jgi:hypothetical protein